MNSQQDYECKPCPFCGKKVDLEDADTLYPTGTVWKDHEDGIRGYSRMRDTPDYDGKVWGMHCPEPAGGCGAEIIGDSAEEALEKWNRRPSDFKHCELCHGAKGGVPGNNQLVNGKSVCDYCHADGCADIETVTIPKELSNIMQKYCAYIAAGSSVEIEQYQRELGFFVYNNRHLFR